MISKKLNSDSTAPVNQSKLDNIAQNIQQLYQQTEQSFLEIGNLLIEAKKEFGKHDHWLNWLKANVDFSVCKAQRLIRVAEMLSKKAPELFSGLDFSKAYILSSLPQGELEGFMALLHDVNGKKKYPKQMTKRELQEVVREWHKERRPKPAPKQQPEPAPETVEKEDEIIPGSEDYFNSRLNSIKSFMGELMDYIDVQPEDSGTRDELAAELRDLCVDTISRIPSEE